MVCLKTFDVKGKVELSYDYRVAVVFSLQTWMAETPAKKKAASTPGYLNVALAGM
jgi:hypothetical protein